MKKTEILDVVAAVLLFVFAAGMFILPFILTGKWIFSGIIICAFGMGFSTFIECVANER